MKKKIQYHEHDALEEGKLPGISNVASATECTGLMPTPPENEAEQAAYASLSSMEIPKPRNGAEKK